MIQQSRHIKALFAALIILLFGAGTVHATHIVGGDLSYRCLGNGKYEITLTVLRDCEGGAPDAQFDEFANIGLFGGNGEIMRWGPGGIGLYQFKFMGDDTIRETLTFNCGMFSSDICVHRATYRDTIELPPPSMTIASNGVILAYQRCCRNAILTNVLDPLETGMTLAVYITPESLEDCNSQPQWDDWPQLYVCRDSLFTIDQVATDEDGDSLVYSLITPYLGATDPMPKPDRPSNPPYNNDLIAWQSGYGLNNLMGGVPLQIDPNTGIITGVPNTEGTFLVGIKVTEYRDGIVYSERRREFELTVVICADGPEASFEFEEDPCDSDYIVEFRNTSKDASSYKWYFEYPDTTIISTEKDPTHTYPGRGSYTVVLEVEDNEGCRDTAVRVVNIYNPDLVPGFTLEATCGDSVRITLCDTSSGLFPILRQDWTVTLGGRSLQDTGKKVLIILDTAGLAIIKLKVTDSVGCMAEFTDTVELDLVKADFEIARDSCDNGLEAPFVNTSIGADSYTWYFNYPDTTDTSMEVDPTFTYPSRGKYNVMLIARNSSGCVDTTIKQITLLDPQLMPGFTVEGSCGDSILLTLCDTSKGWYPLIGSDWTIRNNGIVFQDTGKKIVTILDSGWVHIDLKITDSLGCMASFSDSLFLETVKADFEVDKDSCDNGLEAPFINTSIGANSYTWYFNYPDTIPTSMEVDPTYTYSSRGKYDVMLIARSSSGCVDTIIKQITLLDPQLMPGFTVEGSCGDSILLTLCDTSKGWYPLIGSNWTIRTDGNIFQDTGRKIVTILDSGWVHIDLKITDSLGCMASFSDSLFLETVKADFEVDKDSCDNGLEVPFINTSEGANFYTWYFEWPDTSKTSNEANPTYTFPERGRYDVMLIAWKDSICSDTIIKQVTLLDPQLMPDFMVSSTCEDSLVLSLMDSSSSFYPIVSWEWKVEIGGKTYMASGPKADILLEDDGQAIIMLTITDSLGCMASKTDTVQLRLIDVEFLQDTITICLGDSTRLVVNGDSTLTYEWKPTTGLNLEKPWDPWASPDTTTLYVLCVSDSICTIQKEVLVIVEPLQEVEILGDTSSCDGKFTLVAVSPDTDKFEWSDDRSFTNIIGTGDTIMVMVDGVQTIYVRSGMEGDCRGIDSITLYNRSICLEYEKEINVCIEDTIMINLINCKPDQDLFIRWDRNDIIVTSIDSPGIKVVLPDTGKYTLFFMVANVYGCILRDSICINGYEKPDLTFEAEVECDNPVVKFTVFGDPADYYRWDFGDGETGSGGPMIEHRYKKNGEYTVKLTAGVNGCDTMLFRDIIVVFFDLDSLNDFEVLCGGGMIELNPNGNPSYKYRWSPGQYLDDSTAVNPKATVTESVRFRVIVMDSTLWPECMDTAFVDVIVPPSIDIQVTGDTLLCNQDSTILEAILSNPEGEVSWCDENGNVIDTGVTIVVYPPIGRTCYIVKAIDNFNCLSMDTVCVERYLLDYDIMADDVICEGDSAMIMITNMDMDTLVINGERLGPGEKITIIVNPDSSRTYEFEVLNDFGCIDTARVTINVLQLDIEAKAEPRVIPKGSSSQLTVTSGPGYTYMWTPDDGSLSATDIFDPVATPEVTTIYTVKVTDENGCMATDTTEVVVIPVECTKEFVFVPNAFTPNNDGVNDVVFVRSIIVDEMELIIYNRWGEQVFRSQSQAQGWDGTFNGKLLRPDVYSYYLWVRCIGQEELICKGNITLLK